MMKEDDHGVPIEIVVARLISMRRPLQRHHHHLQHWRDEYYRIKLKGG